MEPGEKDLLDKTFRLARENNRILKTMRRNAFVGGIIRLIIWVLLLGIPLLLYIQYIHPVLSNMVETLDQVQGAGNEFSAQFAEFGELMGRFGWPNVDAAE